MATEEVQEYFHARLMDHELLSPTEERELLCRIHDGCTPEEHKEVHAGPERDEFVQRNMRLVLGVSKRFMRDTDPRFVDIASAGTIGLLKGIDRFDIWKKTKSGTHFRFSTYGVWWIQSTIREELGIYDTRVIKHRSYHETFRRAKNELALLSGDPDVDDAHILSYLERVYGWTEKKLESLRRDLDRHMVTMEAVGEPPTPDDHPVRRLLLEESNDLLNEALNELDFNDVFLLLEHYVHGKTYDELAKQCGVSRERIRQLENLALRELWFKLEPMLG